MDTMAIENNEHIMTGTRPRQSDKYHDQRDFLLLGNWIFSVDQYFLLTNMLIPKQVLFVNTLLRDEVLLWYRSSYETWDQLRRSYGASFVLLCASTLH